MQHLCFCVVRSAHELPGSALGAENIVDIFSPSSRQAKMSPSKIFTFEDDDFEDMMPDEDKTETGILVFFTVCFQCCSRGLLSWFFMFVFTVVFVRPLLGCASHHDNPCTASTFLTTQSLLRIYMYHCRHDSRCGNGRGE